MVGSAERERALDRTGRGDQSRRARRDVVATLDHQFDDDLERSDRVSPGTGRTGRSTQRVMEGSRGPLHHRGLSLSASGSRSARSASVSAASASAPPPRDRARAARRCSRASASWRCEPVRGRAAVAGAGRAVSRSLSPTRRVARGGVALSPRPAGKGGHRRQLPEAQARGRRRRLLRGFPPRARRPPRRRSRPSPTPSRSRRPGRRPEAGRLSQDRDRRIARPRDGRATRLRRRSAGPPPPTSCRRAPPAVPRGGRARPRRRRRGRPARASRADSAPTRRPSACAVPSRPRRRRRDPRRGAVATSVVSRRDEALGRDAEQLVGLVGQLHHQLHSSRMTSGRTAGSPRTMTRSSRFPAVVLDDARERARAPASPARRRTAPSPCRRTACRGRADRSSM